MIDRDEIRRILVDGVLDSEIEWMVESCPSVEHAKAEIRRREGDPNWRTGLPEVTKMAHPDMEPPDERRLRMARKP